VSDFALSRRTEGKASSESYDSSAISTRSPSSRNRKIPGDPSGILTRRDARCRRTAGTEVAAGRAPFCRPQRRDCAGVAEAPRDLWERQPNESAPAYEAWATYRDGQPTATTRSVAQELGKSVTLVQRWSRRHGWQRRLAAWQQHEDRVRAEARLVEAERVGRRHARRAEIAIEAVMRPSLEVVTRLRREPGALADMPLDKLYALAVQASRALPGVVHAERVALGLTAQPGAAVGRRDAVRERVTALTDAELDERLLGIGRRQRPT
jgi:hypothetical protein